MLTVAFFCLLLLGHMLVAWLSSTFDEQHYLHYALSKVDLRVIAVQFCTHLLAAGVIKILERDDAESPYVIFKVSNM